MVGQPDHDCVSSCFVGPSPVLRGHCPELSHPPLVRDGSSALTSREHTDTKQLNNTFEYFEYFVHFDGEKTYFSDKTNPDPSRLLTDLSLPPRGDRCGAGMQIDTSKIFIIDKCIDMYMFHNIHSELRYQRYKRTLLRERMLKL